MAEKKDELVSAFTKMMKQSGRIARRSPIFKKDIKDFGGSIKLQWKIGKLYGYQAFEEDDYSFKVGEQIENPDLFTQSRVSSTLFQWRRYGIQLRSTKRL